MNLHQFGVRNFQIKRLISCETSDILLFPFLPANIYLQSLPATSTSKTGSLHINLQAVADLEQLLFPVYVPLPDFYQRSLPITSDTCSINLYDWYSKVYHPSFDKTYLILFRRAETLKLNPSVTEKEAGSTLHMRLDHHWVQFWPLSSDMESNSPFSHLFLTSSILFPSGRYKSSLYDPVLHLQLLTSTICF